MVQYIQRETYLRQLTDRRDNGEIKIVTGPRRSGKSWLLSRIYKDYLLQQGVAESSIIIVSFDMDDEEETGNLTERQALKDYLYSRIIDDETPYYVILDEVQEVEGFERIVNGLNARDNVDVYVTGSNSHFLSSDIKTIFRGRGDEVRVYPFSFREFCTGRTEPVNELWKEYYTYGGMPGLLRQRTPEQKMAYLQRLWNKTYLDDVVERHKVKNREALSTLADALCSSVGSLTNPNRISNVELASSKIDGTILYPGDIFSYNDVVGERTLEGGFLPAPAYVDGDVKDEVGGGACQVSSTLYAATIFAFLETVERTNHYFPVSYMQLGTDATVTIPDGGNIMDLKFKNDKKYPIKIVSYSTVDEENYVRDLTFEIWGTLEDDDYMPVEFDNSYGWSLTYDRIVEPADPNRPGYKIKLEHEKYYFMDEQGEGYRTLTFRRVYDTDGNLIAEGMLNPLLPTGGPAMDTYYDPKP